MVRRTNRVGSFFLSALICVCAGAQEVTPVEKTEEEPTTEPEVVWSIADGRVLRNDMVFVDRGLIENPLGVVAGKNGSVIVAQPTELTQVFDEDGDGKGDFFRALIGNLGSGERLTSGPMVGSGESLFVTMKMAGRSVDLVAWSAGFNGAPDDFRRVLSLTEKAGQMVIDENDQLATLIPDDAGVWIGTASLAPPDPVVASESGDEGDAGTEEDSKPIQATPVPVAPTLQPAVRIPNELIGEGNTIANLDFLKSEDGGGFLISISDGRVLKARLETVQGKRQGAVYWYAGEATPFAVRAMRILTDGFEFSLTKPADRGVVTTDPLPFQVLNGPVMGGEPLEPISLIEAAIEPDGMTLTLVPSGIGPERLFVFDLSALKSEDGDALASEKSAYTVMAIPNPTVVPPAIEPTISDVGAEPEPDEKTESPEEAETSEESSDEPESEE